LISRVIFSFECWPARRVLSQMEKVPFFAAFPPFPAILVPLVWLETPSPSSSSGRVSMTGLLCACPKWFHCMNLIVLFHGYQVEATLPVFTPLSERRTVLLQSRFVPPIYDAQCSPDFFNNRALKNPMKHYVMVCRSSNDFLMLPGNLPAFLFRCRASYF